MSYVTFRKWAAIIGIIIGGVVGFSVAGENWIAPVIVVTFGIIAVFLLRSRVKEVYADERTFTIAYKAARFTVAVVGIIMPVTGAILLALARHDLSSPIAQAGFTLIYTTCGLLIINYIAYHYYSHKLGGKE